ncbi:MAG TPA: S8 family serine peptidase, partial [Stenotrophomonas sp.]
MRNTVCIHHCLAATLGAALFAGALGLPGQAGADPHFVGSAPPPAAAVTASEKAAGRLMVRLRDTVQVASTRRVAAGLGAGSSAKDAIVIVGEAMQQAGVQPASRDPASGKRVATAGKTPAPVRFVRTIGEGTALVQLAGVRDADDLQRVADELTRDPRVAYAVVDRRRRAFAKASGPIQYVPNDPDFGTQWHWHEPMGGIGAARAWPISRGEGIVVAVLDSGILRDHPDLADSRVLPGYDFISDPMVSRRVGFGRVPGAKDQGDWQGQDECLGDGRSAGSTWHGTHVASTIVESGGNGLGMTGLAPKATLLPVRVLGHCGGDDSDIVDAIAWASGGHVDGVMDNDQPA